MPAPAVIPAPIAYINAAAVKKLVVGSRALAVGGSSLKLTVYSGNGWVEIKTTYEKSGLYEGGNGALLDVPYWRRKRLRVNHTHTGRPPTLP